MFVRLGEVSFTPYLFHILLPFLTAFYIIKSHLLKVFGCGGYIKSYVNKANVIYAGL